MNDGFSDDWNKYAWSMAVCENKLFVGTANGRHKNSLTSLSHGCEVWQYNGTTWKAIVKDGAEQPNGFGQWFNGGVRSMIEYPTGSGNLVVGTYSLQAAYLPWVHEDGCEIWVRRGNV
jgi:hypothetical protein